MSDLLRKIDNIKRIGVVAEVNNSAMPPMVRVEVDEGVLSDWMPYAMPFVGQTSFWCPAKIGVEGIVFSEGGENRICRFFPAFYNQSNAPAGLTDDDFMIFYKNGDTIHHSSASNSLTINVGDQTTINTKKAEVNAPQILLNGDTTVTKTLTVQGFASLNGGFAMNAGFARSAMYQAMSANYSLMSSNVRSSVVGTINIPIIVNNVMTYNIDPILHGVPYLDHGHIKVQPGGGISGGVS